VPLPLRHPLGERGGAVEGLPELLRRLGGVGQPQPSEGEAFVERDGFLEALARVGEAQLLEEVASLQVQGPRLLLAASVLFSGVVQPTATAASAQVRAKRECGRIVILQLIGNEP